MGLREGKADTPNHFDRGGPFYPLVMQYLASLHGYIELLSRHLASTAEQLAKRGATPDGGDDPGQEIIDWYLTDPSRRQVTRLFKRLSLGNHRQKDGIDVDPDELAEELFEESPYLIPWIVNAGGILLISAWELYKEFSDNSPTWEFLRHCRNAAGHGSKFNFLNDEPRRRSAWGDLEITRDLQGTPLFRGPRSDGLLLIGDPIRLLWDIEQAFPGIPPALPANLRSSPSP